jgi:hypothetical protein
MLLSLLSGKLSVNPSARPEWLSVFAGLHQQSLRCGSPFRSLIAPPIPMAVA